MLVCRDGAASLAVFPVFAKGDAAVGTLMSAVVAGVGPVRPGGNVSVDGIPRAREGHSSMPGNNSRKGEDDGGDNDNPHCGNERRGGGGETNRYMGKGTLGEALPTSRLRCRREIAYVCLLVL